MIGFLKRLFSHDREEIETPKDASPKKVHSQNRSKKTKKAKLPVIGSGPIRTKFKGGFVLASYWYRPSRPDRVPEPLSTIKAREAEYKLWLLRKNNEENNDKPVQGKTRPQVPIKV